MARGFQTGRGNPGVSRKPCVSERGPSTVCNVSSKERGTVKRVPPERRWVVGCV